MGNEPRGKRPASGGARAVRDTRRRVTYDHNEWQRTQEYDLTVAQSFGAFSPGGRYLAAADDATIEVRDSRSGTPIARVEMQGVTSLAVSADGTLLVAADDDGWIRAWTLQPVASLWGARLIMPPPSYAQVVYDVQFAANGGLAVASKPAGVDNTLAEFWTVTADQRVRPEPRWQGVMLNSDYQAFSPSPDGGKILLATDEGYWVLQEDEEPLFIDGFYDDGEHAVVAFSPDGRLAAGVEAEGAWIYEVRQHAILEIEDLIELDEPTDVAWSPDNEAIVITSENGLLLCSTSDQGFAYRGLMDDTPGFEAAAFLDSTTIAAKRGDTLLVFSATTTRQRQ